MITGLPAYSDGVGTAKRCHCKHNVTVTGIFSIRRSFNRPKKCHMHCSRGVTLPGFTVSGEACTVPFFRCSKSWCAWRVSRRAARASWASSSATAATRSSTAESSCRRCTGEQFNHGVTQGHPGSPCHHTMKLQGDTSPGEPRLG